MRVHGLQVVKKLLEPLVDPATCPVHPVSLVMENSSKMGLPCPVFKAVPCEPEGCVAVECVIEKPGTRELLFLLGRWAFCSQLLRFHWQSLGICEMCWGPDIGITSAHHVTGFLVTHSPCAHLGCLSCWGLPSLVLSDRAMWLRTCRLTPRNLITSDWALFLFVVLPFQFLIKFFPHCCLSQRMQ